MLDRTFHVVFAVAALLVAVLAAVMAAGFLAAAAYLGFRHTLDPPWAALATAASALALAVAAILTGGFVWRRRVSPVRALAQTGSALEWGDLLGRELVSMASAAPFRTVSLGLIAGFVIGAVPEAMHALGKLGGIGQNRQS